MDDLTAEARQVLEEEFRRRFETEAKRREETEDPKVWENEHGHYMTLGPVADDELFDPADENELRLRCRRIAENEGGGLIEAGVVPSKHGPAAMFIFKTRDRFSPGFTYSGVLIAPTPEGTFRWTFRAQEGEMTGTREAVVTAQLFEEGVLAIESYESSWAQDPYEPQYRGVDRSTLRYVSDDAKYDEMFPAHPLTAVRAVLRDLLRFDYANPPSADLPV